MEGRKRAHIEQWIATIVPSECEEILDEELEQAIVNDDIQNIQQLIALGVNLADYKKRLYLSLEVEDSPLIYAIRHASYETIKLLLEQPSVDPHASHEGITALDVAYYTLMVYEDQDKVTPVIELLSSYNITNSKHRLALYYAKTGNTQKLDRYLRDNNFNVNTPFESIRNFGKKDFLLHEAATSKQALTMEHLLEQGANVEQLNGAGYRAIDLSYKKGHVEGILLLQKYGVFDPEIIIGKLKNKAYDSTYDGILRDVLNGVNLEGKGKSILQEVAQSYKIVSPFRADNRLYLTKKLLLLGAQAGFFLNSDTSSDTSTDSDDDSVNEADTIDCLNDFLDREEVLQYVNQNRRLDSKTVMALCTEVHQKLFDFLGIESLDQSLSQDILFFRFWANRYNLFFNEFIHFSKQVSFTASSGENALSRMQALCTHSESKKTLFGRAIKGYLNREATHQAFNVLGYSSERLGKMPRELQVFIAQEVMRSDLTLIIESYDPCYQKKTSTLVELFVQNISRDWSQMIPPRNQEMTSKIEAYRP